VGNASFALHCNKGVYQVFNHCNAQILEYEAWVCFISCVIRPDSHYIVVHKLVYGSVNALFTINGVTSTCPAASSVYFTPSDIDFKRMSREKATGQLKLRTKRVQVLEIEDA